MDGTWPVVLGDRGRFVIPSEVRASHALVAGDTLVLVESPNGLLLLSRAQLKDLVREQLRGADLVDELLVERRRAAASEDAG